MRKKSTIGVLLIKLKHRKVVLAAKYDDSVHICINNLEFSGANVVVTVYRLWDNLMWWDNLIITRQIVHMNVREGRCDKDKRNQDRFIKAVKATKPKRCKTQMITWKRKVS